MKFETLALSAVLIGAALPALAQTSYYVVRGPDKHCQVVEQRPTTKETTVVSPDGVTYKTKTEATDAMKTVTVCN